jgi:SAM-dependent methyltransferase
MLQPKSGEQILDAGSGNGIYANTIASYFKAQAYGCDIDKKRIFASKIIAKCLNNKAEFICQNIEKINFPSSSLDKIICIEVLEHIKDDVFVVKNFFNILKQKGVLILSTSKKENLTESEEQRFQEAKKGEHVRSGYELADLKKMLKKEGFLMIKWVPYYRFFAKRVITFQQRIYNKKMTFLNVLTFPIFSFFARLDFLLSRSKNWNNNFGWYRGFIIKAIKK